MISHISLVTIALSLVAIPHVHGANFQVTVGGPGGVVAFNPPNINANVGDVVTFIFQQKNHTVTQSSFASPCSALEGGFDSGFIPVADSVTSGFQQAQLTVENMNPIWGYCRQAGHCQKGMVFAINPGSSDKFAAFQAAATGNTTAEGGSSSAASVVPSSAAASVAPSSTAASSGTTFTSIANPAPSAATTIAALPSGTTSAASSTSTGAMTNDHRIVVGSASGATTYTPANISAQPGDTITFEFHAKNHTATQSSFGAPCRSLAQTSQTGQVGFDSGFMPVAGNATTFPTYTIQVNDSAPIWVFCAQTGHCGKGMVFSANAVESGSNTFEAFQQRAMSQNGTAGNTTSGAGRVVARTAAHATFLAALFGVIVGLLF